MTLSPLRRSRFVWAAGVVKIPIISTLTGCLASQHLCKILGDYQDFRGVLAPFKVKVTFITLKLLMLVLWERIFHLLQVWKTFFCHQSFFWTQLFPSVIGIREIHMLSLSKIQTMGFLLISDWRRNQKRMVINTSSSNKVFVRLSAENHKKCMKQNISKVMLFWHGLV